jgi:hypothetical protein
MLSLRSSDTNENDDATILTREWTAMPQSPEDGPTTQDAVMGYVHEVHFVESSSILKDRSTG